MHNEAALVVVVVVVVVAAAVVVVLPPDFNTIDMLRKSQDFMLRSWGP